MHWALSHSLSIPSGNISFPNMTSIPNGSSRPQSHFDIWSRAENHHLVLRDIFNSFLKNV